MSRVAGRGPGRDGAGGMVAQPRARQAHAAHRLFGEYLPSRRVCIGRHMRGHVVMEKIQPALPPTGVGIFQLDTSDVISCAMAVLLPAGSYLVFWPLLAALIVLLAVRLAGKGPAKWQWLAGFTGLVTSALLFAPLVYLLYIFLTFQWPMLAGVGLLISFGFLASAFCLDVIFARHGWYPPLLVLLAGSAGMIGIGVLKSHHGAEYPEADPWFIA